MATYKSQAARDAQASGHGGESYWDYLEAHASGLAERFPELAEKYLTRDLGQTLAGNDGD